MTYTDLQTAIKDWLENYEARFVANLPVFVRNAEDRIFSVVQPPVVQTYTTGTTFTQGVNTVTKPSGYRSAFEFRVINNNTVTYMTQKDPTFLLEAYPATGVTGVPRYYADANETQLIVAPTPASTYSYVLGYYKLPESLTAAAGGTTWLSTNFEQLLLYASLVEAAIFMKEEPDVVREYDNKFVDALMTTAGIGNKLTRADAYRKGRVKSEQPARETE